MCCECDSSQPQRTGLLASWHTIVQFAEHAPNRSSKSVEMKWGQLGWGEVRWAIWTLLQHDSIFRASQFQFLQTNWGITHPFCIAVCFIRGRAIWGRLGVEYPSIYFTTTRNRHVFCFLEHLTVHRNIRGLVLEATKCISISIISVGSSCFESDQIKRPSFVTLTGGGGEQVFSCKFLHHQLASF